MTAVKVEVQPVVLCVGGPNDGQSFTAAEWAARQACLDHHGRQTRTSWLAAFYVEGAWTGRPVLPRPLDEPQWSVTPWCWTGPEIPRGYELAGRTTPVHENAHETENENGD